MGDNTVYVSLFINPLGDLHATYEFEISDVSFGFERLRLGTGGYVYDYQEFRGITWPFGKKVRPTELDGFSAESPENDVELITARETKEGGYELVIDLVDVEEAVNFQVEFKLKDVVNRDAFFHKAVYSITPPGIEYEDRRGSNLLDIGHLAVDTTVHFSFDIRSHSVTIAKFDTRTGSRLEQWSAGTWLRKPLSYLNDDRIDQRREGDVIETKWKGSLENDEEIDLHVDGSNIPYLAQFSRYHFWIAMWVVLMTLFVTSAYLTIQI